MIWHRHSPVSVILVEPVLGRTGLGVHVAGERINGTKSMRELEECAGWSSKENHISIINVKHQQVSWMSCLLAISPRSLSKPLPYFEYFGFNVRASWL